MSTARTLVIINWHLILAQDTDNNESGLDLDDSLREKLEILDLNSGQSTKKFLNDYLGMFDDLPAPLSKNKLTTIIDEIIVD